MAAAQQSMVTAPLMIAPVIPNVLSFLSFIPFPFNLEFESMYRLCKVDCVPQARLVGS